MLAVKKLQNLCWLGLGGHNLGGTSRNNEKKKKKELELKRDRHHVQPQCDKIMHVDMWAMAKGETECERCPVGDSESPEHENERRREDDAKETFQSFASEKQQVLVTYEGARTVVEHFLTSYKMFLAKRSSEKIRDLL